MSKLSVTKKQSHDYSLVAMAYHEAGHIICGSLNCMKITSASIMPSIFVKDKVGETHYDFVEPEKFSNKFFIKALLITQIQMDYAGLVAEKIYYKDICGSDTFPAHLRDWSYDMDCAAQTINKYKLAKSGKERYMFKKQIHMDVENLLIEYWGDIKIIAHELYKRKKLSFQELKSVLIRKSNNSDFWRSKFKKIQLIHTIKNISNESLVKPLILEDAIFSV